LTPTFIFVNDCISMGYKETEKYFALFAQNWIDNCLTCIRVYWALIGLYLTTCCQKLMVLCWRDSSRWDIVLVLVLESFGQGFTNSIFSITRTRTTTRTRNNPIGISGICHLSLCSQIAPKGPFFPSVVSEKA
jgi:hypothetical protein